jgi:hypothetical protein
LFGYSKRSMQKCIGFVSSEALIASHFARSKEAHRSGYSRLIHFVQVTFCRSSMVAPRLCSCGGSCFILPATSTMPGEQTPVPPSRESVTSAGSPRGGLDLPVFAADEAPRLVERLRRLRDRAERDLGIHVLAGELPHDRREASETEREPDGEEDAGRTRCVA